MNPATARPVPAGVRQIVFDGSQQKCFALTLHEFGTIEPERGTFTKIPLAPDLEKKFSWPKGIAIEPLSGDVFVMTSHVYQNLFRFHPNTGRWQLISERRGGLLGLEALAYVPERQLLFALQEPQDGMLKTLLEYNLHGAVVGDLTLKPAILLVREHNLLLQLQHASGRLVLLVHSAQMALPRQSRTSGNRLFTIDPATGEVAAERA